MCEFETIKMDEALSDPKWSCAMKEELELIEFHKSKKGLLMHQRRYALKILKSLKWSIAIPTLLWMNQDFNC